MSDPYFQTLFADRIGGVNYGKGTDIYKFEKIKRAKRKAIQDHPDKQLLDFGIGENDSPADDAVRMMTSTGCDGVVIGRGCLGRPWLFRDLADVFAGREPSPSPNLGEVGSIMIRHAELLVDHFGDKVGVGLFRRHPSWYLKGFPAGPALRDAMARFGSIDELRELVGQLDPEVPFPEEANTMVRGHSQGPRPVRLPHGFLSDRDASEVGRDAEQVVSGG